MALDVGEVCIFLVEVVQVLPVAQDHPPQFQRFLFRSGNLLEVGDDALDGIAVLFGKLGCDLLVILIEIEPGIGEVGEGAFFLVMAV